MRPFARKIYVGSESRQRQAPFLKPLVARHLRPVEPARENDFNALHFLGGHDFLYILLQNPSKRQALFQISRDHLGRDLGMRLWRTRFFHRNLEIFWQGAFLFQSESLNLALQLLHALAAAPDQKPPAGGFHDKGKLALASFNLQNRYIHPPEPGLKEGTQNQVRFQKLAVIFRAKPPRFPIPQNTDAERIRMHGMTNIILIFYPTGPR